MTYFTILFHLHLKFSKRNIIYCKNVISYENEGRGKKIPNKSKDNINEGN